MKFSILIPSYNCRGYIFRCLDSIFRQSFEDYEVVLCDDGSTDSTQSFLNGYLADHADFAKKFTLLKNESNSGGIITRNRLARAAKGDYVVWIDADDEIDSDYLKTFSGMIDETGSDIVEIPMLVVVPKSDDILQKFGNRNYSGADCIDVFFERKVNMRWYLTSKAVKREVMLSSLPEDCVMSLDDVFFALNMFAHAKSYSSRDTESHYVYYYGIGFWSSKDLMPISLGRYDDILSTRIHQLNYNFNILSEFMKSEKWCNELYNSCVGFELISDIGKIETMQDRKSALSHLLSKFNVSISPKK